MKTKNVRKSLKKIRYAVVGLGHIAQKAVLPAFANAKNSEMVAYVTGDTDKAKKISKVFKKAAIYTYEQFDELLESDTIDAVYVALPNHLHYEYTKRALKKNVHVLCEKPFAMTPGQCLELARLSESQNTKLMVAYRLHFEPANLETVKIANSGRLGKLRYFNSIFSHQVNDKDNIRLRSEEGGTPAWDIGIYCINAVRMIFKEEPVEVFAQTGNSGEARFSETEEQLSATLKFSEGKLATFVCSFGAHEIAEYSVFGTKGHLKLESAYSYEGKRTLSIKVKEKTSRKIYPSTDQFGPEIEYFSNCILKNRNPEPSGYEGLADIQVIAALHQSFRTGKAVKLSHLAGAKVQKNKIRANSRQKIVMPPAKEFPLQKVKSDH